MPNLTLDPNSFIFMHPNPFTTLLQGKYFLLNKGFVSKVYSNEYDRSFLDCKLKYMMKNRTPAE